MTRKTTAIYGMLFLCVFAFALSFTLASKAYAGPPCCTEMCPPPNQASPSYDGIAFRIEGEWICFFIDDGKCPYQAYQCSTSDP